MTHEQLQEFCSEETLPSSWKLTRIEEEGGQRMYIPTLIKRDGEDLYSRFVVGHIESLKQQLENLDRPVSHFKAHGRRRSKKELNQIYASHKTQKRQIPHIIRVFCGTEKLPIKFIKDDAGGIVGFEIDLPNGSQPNLSS
jgi:hypothetical protein